MTLLDIIKRRKKNCGVVKDYKMQVKSGIMGTQAKGKSKIGGNVKKFGEHGKPARVPEF